MGSYCPRVLEANDHTTWCQLTCARPFENPDDLASPVVSISQSEFDGLRKIASKYGTILAPSPPCDVPTACS